MKTKETDSQDKHLKFYQDLVETSQDLIWRCDLEGRYTYLNPAWEETFGYKTEEMLGKKFTEFQQPEIVKQDLKEFTRLLQEGIVKGYETTLQAKSGREIHLSFNAKFVRDETGQVIGTCGTAFDITKRRQSEAELKRQADELIALSTVGRAVNATLSLSETAKAVLTEILRVVQPDLTFIFLCDGERMVLQEVLPSEAKTRLGVIPEHRVGECMCGLAAREKKALFSLDIFKDSRCTWEECKKTGIRSFAALPLCSGDEMIGVIGLASDKERDFEGQRRFLETLSSQVSIALANARLFDAAKRELTERKKTDLALSEAYQLNEQIIRSAQEGIIVYDTSLRYKVWNPFMETLTGVPASEILGKHPMEIFPFLQEARVIDRLQKAISGKPVSPIDFPFKIPKTGKSAWLSDTSASIRNTAGKVIGVIGIVNDITERIKSEISLKQLNNGLIRAKEAAERSEEKFRVMLKNSNDAFVLINKQGEQVYISDAATRDTGYSIEELKGPIQNVICPEDWEIVSKAWREILKNKESIIRVQYRHKHKYKGYLWYEAVAQNFFDNPLINAVVVNVRDITRIKETELELIRAKEKAENSEQLYKLIYNSTPVLMHTVDLKGIITAVNDYWLQTLGYEASEVIRTPSLQYLTEASKPVYVKKFSELLQKGKVTNIEVQAVKKNGEILDVLAASKVVYDPSGKPLQLMTNLLDITERKRTEGALLNVQKLESLGILAGGIAHDFNNLLGSLFGYIDLAAATTKEKNITGYLEEALGTIDRARGLTRQLLTFAKGGAPVKKIDTLTPFIQETAKFALSGSSVSCRFNLQPDLWLCDYDKTQIGQVIDNLIINAQQAMPDGGTMEVTAENISLGPNSHPVLSAGHYVKISVIDHGIGMPKEILPRIFDPFFTTKTKGHGLGLATCYSIINRHGGCIEAESEPGKGSLFHFYLPATPQSIPKASPAAPVQHRGTGTILVMDDEDVIRKTFSSMLKFLGYTVICKENGREAIDFLTAEIRENRKIKAMILDLTVPGGMNGKDAIPLIRKIDPEMPVFVASGYADDPVMADPKQYGFTDSLCKPFRIADLAEMLNKNMKEKRQ